MVAQCEASTLWKRIQTQPRAPPSTLAVARAIRSPSLRIVTKIEPCIGLASRMNATYPLAGDPCPTLAGCWPPPWMAASSVENKNPWVRQLDTLGIDPRGSRHTCQNPEKRRAALGAGSVQARCLTPQLRSRRRETRNGAGDVRFPESTGHDSTARGAVWASADRVY